MSLTCCMLAWRYSVRMSQSPASHNSRATPSLSRSRSAVLRCKPGISTLRRMPPLPSPASRPWRLCCAGAIPVLTRNGSQSVTRRLTCSAISPARSAGQKICRIAVRRAVATRGCDRSKRFEAADAAPRSFPVRIRRTPRPRNLQKTPNPPLDVSKTAKPKILWPMTLSEAPSASHSITARSSASLACGSAAIPVGGFEVDGHLLKDRRPIHRRT